MITAQDSTVEVELVRGGGGVFDIDLDGGRVYSKHATGRFPTDEEVRGLLP
ncbi:MAG: hypothetical protein GKS00_15410 [Alphaproteobacteria bacterium]|nr:hypothetical protein [Alphaproteobacteria bacterium]